MLVNENAHTVDAMNMVTYNEFYERIEGIAEVRKEQQMVRCLRIGLPTPIYDMVSSNTVGLYSASLIDQCC